MGDERNKSWSLRDRILLEGTWNVRVDNSGGGGRAGVSGVGTGAEGAARRRLGSNLGSRSLRLGIVEGGGTLAGCSIAMFAINWGSTRDSLCSVYELDVGIPNSDGQVVPRKSRKFDVSTERCPATGTGRHTTSLYSN